MYRKKEKEEVCGEKQGKSRGEWREMKKSRRWIERNKENEEVDGDKQGKGGGI